MNINDRRDSIYTDKGEALKEHARIIRQGGKAYMRRYNCPRLGTVYRLRVQKKPALSRLLFKRSLLDRRLGDDNISSS
jgi:hypothetical protein